MSSTFAVTMGLLECLSLLFVISFALLCQETHSLKIVGLVVPNRMQSRDRARFSCYFSLEGNTLHSLTWTKDGFPFFLYRYGEAFEDEVTNSSGGVDIQKTANLAEPEAHKITYVVPGMTVDAQGSTLNEVSLSRVDHRASGTVGCRVRAQLGNFSDERKSNITVIAPPKHAPQIHGGIPFNATDEWLHLNCSSPPAHPPVALEWAINGLKVPLSFITTYPGVLDGEGLTASVTGLSFTLHKEYFLGDGVLRIRCSGSVMGDPGVVSEVTFLKEDVRKTLALWHDEDEEENGAARPNNLGASLLMRALLLLACYSQRLT